MAKRLIRSARRAQLLEVAFEIISKEGTDALTLTRLAERAEVSKPIAYDHFGTRAGLLAALYRYYEEQQNEQMRAALAEGGDSLPGAAGVVASAYVDCLLTTGPEYEEISAALLAYEETRDYLEISRAYYVEEYRRAFGPFAPLEGPHAHTVLAGLVGAADAIAREAHSGAISRDEAIATLTEMIVASLTALAAAAATDGSGPAVTPP